MVIESMLHLQIEAAMGGQDVVHFCGGLAAVLGACGVPVHRAVPHALTVNPVNHLTQPVVTTDAQLEAPQTDAVSSSDGITRVQTVQDETRAEPRQRWKPNEQVMCQLHRTVRVSQLCGALICTD